MRIGFAWWGTGGHVFPIQSLIKFINKHHVWEHQLFWFGEKTSLEHSVCQELSGSFKSQDTYEWFTEKNRSDSLQSMPTTVETQLAFLPIISWKRRREKEFVAILKNIWWLFRILVGVFQSLYHIIRHKIDVIFCKWWFVSLPVVFAAWILRKPILLHESDTKPWLSNRICSRFATTIFTGFEDVFPWKEIVVWQILDDDLVAEITATNKADIADVLVIGGSQWSQSLYDALYDLLVANQAKFEHTRFHIVLWTENQSYIHRFEKFSFVKVYPFVSQKQMWDLLAKCDLSITRGGTTSLAEQELFNIKKIIVPIPWTHDQLKNAQYYQKEHGDILVEQLDEQFQEKLQSEVLEYATYLKQPYTDPLESIQKAKEIIVWYLLK